MTPTAMKQRSLTPKCKEVKVKAICNEEKVIEINCNEIKVTEANSNEVKVKAICNEERVKAICNEVKVVETNLYIEVKVIESRTNFEV